MLKNLFCVNFFFIVLTNWSVLAPCWAADKLDPPSADEKSAARHTIAELYKGEYENAKTPTARTSLAKKLIEVGNDTKDDPASQFELWDIAKSIAVKAADYDLAARAIGKIDDRFTIDALSMKVESMEFVANASEAVPDYKKLTPSAEALLDESIACERFDSADCACARLIEFSGKLGDPNVIARSKVRLQSLSKIEAAFAQVTDAIKVLKDQPADQAANGAVGRFRCFIKNDWEKGLPSLARSGDATLSRIAKKDISQPEEPSSQVALADDWWSFAENEPDDIKIVIQQHAAFWYQKAIPKLAGLAKEKAEKRTASIRPPDPQIISDGRVESSKQDDKPVAKPKSPAAWAAQIDREAAQCRSAKDALLIYKLFLADNTVPDEAKQRARKQISVLEEPAAKSYVRLGTKWVSPDDARAAQQQAESLIREALDLLNARNIKAAKESLEKASRTDPNATRADFMLGVLYALVGRNYSQARTHLMECLRREPQDVCTLNNLAVVELMMNESQSALSYMRQAKDIDPTNSELAHNVRKVLAESGKRNLALSPTAESSFSELYGDLLKNGASEEKATRGWLYMPPIAADIEPSDAADSEDKSPEEPPKSIQAPPKKGRAHGAKPAEPRHINTPDPGGSIVLSGGTGFVVYPHYILTNRHVIKGSRNIVVSDPTSKKHLRANIVAESSNPDLAILRCDGLDVPPIAINPHLPGRGTDIMVLGFPEFFDIGTGLKTTRGSIVGLPSDDTEGMCLYDATTNHGNSGGPICDNTGRVVAVVRVAFNLMEKLNGGIPTEQVTPFLSKYISGFRASENGDKILSWPEVDSLVSKSTVLVLCKGNRESHFIIPDGDDSSFQDNSTSGASKATKRSNKIVKSEPNDIEDDCCIACRGTGKARCPDCQNGTVLKVEIEKSWVAGVEIDRPHRYRVPCKTCDGTGQIQCPVCHGRGIESGN